MTKDSNSVDLLSEMQASVDAVAYRLSWEAAVICKANYMHVHELFIEILDYPDALAIARMSASHARCIVAINKM